MNLASETNSSPRFQTVRKCCFLPLGNAGHDVRVEAIHRSRISKIVRRVMEVWAGGLQCSGKEGAQLQLTRLLMRLPTTSRTET